jgi:hypothetical protein
LDPKLFLTPLLFIEGLQGIGRDLPAIRRVEIPTQEAPELLPGLLGIAPEPLEGAELRLPILTADLPQRPLRAAQIAWADGAILAEVRALKVILGLLL